jgi:hypothetical protein
MNQEDLPVVGRRVRIEKNKRWEGVYIIEHVYENGIIVINHPVRGPGGFYPDECTLIPLSKLEKALK